MNITENKKMIVDALNSIVHCLDRIDAEREQIKEISKNVYENTDIPKKMIRKLARIIQRSSAVAEKQEIEFLDTLIDEIINK